MRYYLVAGEASGDLHGSNLMKGLKERDANSEFRYFGGNLMEAEGGELVKHYADMAFMGFVEVAFNLRTILGNLKACKQDILTWQPDVLILIDFPGFNLKIAQFAKANGILVCYYISPKVWAWNQKRVLKIKRVVDYMFCILPFEVDFYKGWGMKVDYVGNPLLDAVSAFKPNPDFIDHYKLTEKPIVALLPGSRKQEINYLLPGMVALAGKFPQYQFVVAGAPSFKPDFYEQFIGGQAIPVLFDVTYDILKNAKAAIVASGTATLEAALFHVPQVVVYKGHPVTIGIARMLIKIRFISLVNLIMDRLVVKELIQGDYSADAANAELEMLLHNTTYRESMLKNYTELDQRMGKPGASAKAAELIVQYTTKK
ncbi:lipid-A-disaccharide synthase [Mucilaginibacter gracilis]|uniref:Lipid-A-disaccharide synthase n=1 Tax=Mucilaginibacter gracilis TaxID=423350 RepID=A0A495J0V6_9SPHI|nr:lipid-A-disaccharide synthase [Mucilaginibacter gracilis]RKR81944.1 lipid-A-disaccharide synthase [Mucilaginibacter gracilis]